MKTNHTPGPWKSFDNRPEAIYSQATKKRVAVVDYDCDRGLISAAPDMLAALEVILGHLAPEVAGNAQCCLYSDALSPKHSDDETIVEYLRKAINKAKGLQ